MKLGLILSENIRIYDSIRQEQSFLQRFSWLMLKKAFPSASPGIRGSVVAADNLLRALLLNSNIPINLLVHSPQLRSTEDYIASSDMPLVVKERTSVTSIEEIFTGRIQPPLLNATFSPLPSTRSTFTHEGIELSQTIRRKIGGAIYPITLLTHGLSYHHLLYECFLRFILEGTFACDSIICTSSGSKQVVLNAMTHIEEEFKKSTGITVKYQGRVDIIPLCVDCDFFQTHSKSKARSLLKLPSNTFIVLVLSRLSPLKADLHPFITMIGSLAGRNRGKDLLCVVAGTEDPGYVRHLQTAILDYGLQTYFRFMVEVTDATKSLLMQAADVFTSPTDCLTESFGVTLIEAMAAGCPQVVPDWNGYRDTVRHGKTGFLACTRWMNLTDDLDEFGPMCGWQFDQFAIGQSVAIDMGEMEGYLDRLMNDVELCQQMSVASREVARTGYSFSTIAKRYNDLWDELGGIAGGIHGAQQRAGFAWPRYYSTFKHYASTSLTGETALTITVSGESALRLKRLSVAVPEYLTHFQILDSKVLEMALHTLVEHKSGRRGEGLVLDYSTGMRISAVIDWLRTQSTLHSHHLLRHILWLVKYGYVQVLSD